MTGLWRPNCCVESLHEVMNGNTHPQTHRYIAVFPAHSTVEYFSDPPYCNITPHQLTRGGYPLPTPPVGSPRIRLARLWGKLGQRRARSRGRCRDPYDP